MHLPIGAINPDRLEIFKERMDIIGYENDIGQFLYGSHFSGLGILKF